MIFGGHDIRITSRFAGDGFFLRHYKIASFENLTREELMIPAKLIKRRCYESMSRQKVQSILSTPPTPKPSPRHNNSIPKDLYML